MAALQDYDYPGNVRELKNLIEYALISSNGRPIRVFHLHFMAAAPVPASPVKEVPAIEENVSTAPAKNRGEEEILLYLRKHKQISNSQCQSLLGVSHHRASYLLKTLHKEGRLRKEGERRWAVYVLA